MIIRRAGTESHRPAADLFRSPPHPIGTVDGGYTYFADGSVQAVGTWSGP